MTVSSEAQPPDEVTASLIEAFLDATEENEAAHRRATKTQRAYHDAQWAMQRHMATLDGGQGARWLHLAFAARQATARRNLPSTVQQSAT